MAILELIAVLLTTETPFDDSFSYNSHYKYFLDIWLQIPDVEHVHFTNQSFIGL